MSPLWKIPFLFSLFITWGQASVSTPSHLREEVGVREPRRILELDGIQIAIHDSDPTGSKSTILCLHAIGHGGRDFTYFENAFSNHFRIVTVDWPGQGFSSQDNRPASGSRYSDILNKVIVHLNLNKFVILGNSIGGAAAIRFAAQHPEKITALILSNPGGLDQGGFFAKTYIWWLEQKFRAGARGEEWFMDWFKNYYDQVLITKDAESEKVAIVRSAFEIAPRLAEAWMSFRDSAEDLRSLIPLIKIPVLFAWASQDQYVQWERNKDAISRFTNKKIVHFPAGHAPFLETPDRFNEEIRTFFSEISFN